MTKIIANCNCGEQWEIILKNEEITFKCPYCGRTFKRVFDAYRDTYIIIDLGKIGDSNVE